MSSVSSRSRAPTPLDALQGDFVELGGNVGVPDNEVNSPMLSRSGSNCSDDDSSQTARSRLWVEYLQVILVFDVAVITSNTSLGPM